MKTNPITPGLRQAMQRFEAAYLELKHQFTLLEQGGDQDLSKTPVNETLVKMNNEVEEQAKVLQWRLDFAIEQGYTTREESDSWTVNTIRDKVDEWKIPMPPTEAHEPDEIQGVLEGIFRAKKEMIDAPRWSEMKQRILLAQAYSDFNVAKLEGLTWGEAMNELDKLYVPRDSLRYYTLEERLDHAWRHKGMHKATTELMYQEYQEGKFSDEEIHGQLNALDVPVVYPTSKFVMHLNNRSTTAVVYMLSGTVDQPMVGPSNMEAVLAHPDIYADVKMSTTHPLSPVDGAWVLHAINSGEIKAEERSLSLTDRRVTVYRTKDIAKLTALL